MKITYDKEVDAINLSLRGEKIARTIEVAPEILLDVDGKGRALSIEIIGASEKIGKKNFRSVVIGTRSVALPMAA